MNRSILIVIPFILTFFLMNMAAAGPCEEKYNVSRNAVEERFADAYKACKANEAKKQENLRKIENAGATTRQTTERAVDNTKSSVRAFVDGLKKK